MFAENPGTWLIHCHASEHVRDLHNCLKLFCQNLLYLLNVLFTKVILFTVLSLAVIFTDNFSLSQENKFQDKSDRNCLTHPKIH